MAVCESCPNIGPVRPVFGGILMCESCITKETELTLANMTPIKQEERVTELNKVLEQARLIDNSIQVKEDIFNAETISILDLKKSIDSDPAISNKPYKLFETLLERFNHFTQVIFDKQHEIVEDGNRQKAIQIYFNEYSNTLRAEEREKFRIADINYKPSVTKPVVKTIKTSPKKIDKIALKKYATELGVNEFILQMLVVSKGVSVEKAAELLRKSINETKSLGVKS